MLNYMTISSIIVLDRVGFPLVSCPVKKLVEVTDMDKKEYMKQWRLKNKERISEYNKQYCKDNKEYNSQRHKRYHEENKEKRKAKQKEYYENNKEHYAKRRIEQREYHIQRGKDRHKFLRNQVIDLYSNGTNKCVVCKTSKVEHLHHSCPKMKDDEKYRDKNKGSCDVHLLYYLAMYLIHPSYIIPVCQKCHCKVNHKKLRGENYVGHSLF